MAGLIELVCAGADKDLGDLMMHMAPAIAAPARPSDAGVGPAASVASAARGGASAATASGAQAEARGADSPGSSTVGSGQDQGDQEEPENTHGYCHSRSLQNRASEYDYDNIWLSGGLINTVLQTALAANTSLYCILYFWTIMTAYGALPD